MPCRHEIISALIVCTTLNLQEIPVRQFLVITQILQQKRLSVFILVISERSLTRVTYLFPLANLSALTSELPLKMTGIFAQIFPSWLKKEEKTLQYTY